jgi:hypothetical protein
MQKARAEYVRELKRRGSEIEDYVWVVEFHTNGFPHYHWFVLVKDQGIKGQLGAERLKEVWRWGDYVNEGYIKSQAHWDNWVGYASKTGYVHKQNSKVDQAGLPAWALDSTFRIRRWGHGSPEDGEDREVAPAPNPVVGGSKPPPVERWWGYAGIDAWMSSFTDPPQEETSDDERTNRQIISSCGGFTQVLLVSQNNMGVQDYGHFAISYEDFKGLGGVYVKKFGVCVQMSPAHFLDFYHTHPPLNPMNEPLPTARRREGGAGCADACFPS